MGANTKIEWATHTLNFWEGCTKVSEGCVHCYAEARNARFGGGTAPNWGPGAPRRLTAFSTWERAARWNRHAEATGTRPRIFVNSLSDILDPAVPIEWFARALEVMWENACCDFLWVTKRPELWLERIADAVGWLSVQGRPVSWLFAWRDGRPPHNFWIGTTVENQPRADERIPSLLAIPARVHFLSAEPLLGAVDLIDISAATEVSSGRLGSYDVLRDGIHGERIDWVICGGESGNHARPMHPDWARSLRDQCASAGVPFFFKQWGEWIPGDHVEDLPDHDEPRRITQIALDGTVASSTHMPPEKRDGMCTICLVGKETAGRLLDGVEYSAFPSPEVRA